MAGIKDFKRVVGANAEVAELQKRLLEFFVPIIANPLLDGVLLTNVAVGTSPTKVEHKLQREIQGWIVVRNGANSVVWEPVRELTSIYVTLQATADTTVDLWVF